MAGTWLTALVWTLPAGKLVLLAALWLRHGAALAAGDLAALVPEVGVAAALTLAQRGVAGRRVARAALALVAAILAVLAWLAVAPWAFAGAPVGFALLRRLGLDPATLRTALVDPALRVQLAGWLLGFLGLWAGVALVLRLLRPWTRAVRPAARTAALAGCVAAALALATLRPAPPLDRLALAVALDPGTGVATSGDAPDPVAAAALAAPPRKPTRAVAGIRNVLLLVLESVRFEPGSRFVTGFPQAIHFDRAYAHHPRSVKTLEALLFGIYPSPGLLSAAWAIDLYDVDAIGALPRMLARHGFQSHYFSAMPLGFDNYGGTLRAAGFDEVAVVSGDGALTWGAPAAVLFDRVATTLERGAAAHVPELVTAWSAECHMPYDFAGERVPEGDPRARYRACLDALAGDVAGLLDRLRRDGILTETLVVVLGDHGQIFASEKPDELGHGRHVYEQSLRIPVLLFVPGAAPRHDDRLLQPVDLPSTILAALGIAIPPAWVGHDLLDPADRGRPFVVALSTLSDGQAAVVDAHGGKLVRSASDEVTRYDLASDPAEEHGTPATGDARRTAERRIATYEEIAARTWDAHRRAGGGALAFDGRALAARWAPGPCVTTELTAGGDLHVAPATNVAMCATTTDPFERRLARAFATAPLAGGFALRLTIDLDAGPGDAATPHVIARVWGRDDTFAAPLDRAVPGQFQTVTLALPAPPHGARDGETMVAIAVEPPRPYLLRSIEVVPAAQDDAPR